MTDDNRQEDSDWLKDAFERALRGDNGVAPDAARPAANPFGVNPQSTDPRESEGPVGHNELDLDFETESTVPAQAFLPVVDFGDEPTVDENDVEPDPFAVFSMSETTTPTEPTDVIDVPDETVPLIQPTVNAVPEHIEANPTEALDTIDAPTVVAPVQEPTPTGTLDGLDALFGEDKFAEATTAIISAPTAADTIRMTREPNVAEQPLAQTETSEPKAPRAGIPANAVTYGIAAGVSILLAIGGFVLGSTLAGGSTATPEPTATADSGATATREPGTWAWNQLYGGECIEPFPGAWAESFEVVDCETPHAAQLVAVGDLAEGLGGAYPGVDEAAALAETACSAQGVLDLTKAGAYPNMQISTSYAPSQEQWDAGNTSYYCFVSLADASPITGSVVGTGPEVTQ